MRTTDEFSVKYNDEVYDAVLDAFKSLPVAGKRERERERDR